MGSTKILFLLMLWMACSLVGRSNLYAQYELEDLNNSMNLLTDYVEKHPNGFFERDAYFRLGEVNFFRALKIAETSRFTANSLDAALRFYGLAEKLLPVDFTTEAAIYGQIYCYYTLLRKSFSPRDNNLLIYREYQKLLDVNAQSIFINDVKMMSAHAMFMAGNYKLTLSTLDSIRVDDQNWGFVRYLQIWSHYRELNDSTVLRLAESALDSSTIFIKDSVRLADFNTEIAGLFAKTISTAYDPSRFDQHFEEKPYFPLLAYYTAESFLSYTNTRDNGLSILQKIVNLYPESYQARQAISLVTGQDINTINLVDGAQNVLFDAQGNQNIQLQNLQITGFADVPRIVFFQPKELLTLSTASSTYRFRKNILNRYEKYHP